MPAGKNGGFDPYRDAHGRWAGGDVASAGGDGAAQINAALRSAAATLAYWYGKTGSSDWDKALKKYNGSSVYVHMVAENVAQLEQAGFVA